MATFGSALGRMGKKVRQDRLAYKNNPVVKSTNSNQVEETQTEQAFDANRRESMFVQRDVPDEELTEEELLSRGIDIIKKRRGTIFGNNTGTAFGN